MNKKKFFLSQESEWDMQTIKAYDEAIGEIARDYGLETYPNQIEIISSEQMLDAFCANGMPIGYSHWSFGKKLLRLEKEYKRGHMSLAYEIVINSNPSIAYLMEDNSTVMQALVIAHACYGHNSFFKNNYLFKSWTNAEAIIDYLVFAKKYIGACEEKHGIDAVEKIIDACHSLMNYGVDRYKHSPKLSLKEESIRQKKRQQYLQTQVNELWKTLPKKTEEKTKSKKDLFPAEPQENILYFIEKNAPLLEPWQREIIRIIRKIAQYFYPQRQTKVMNEGWATFWHYQLINDLYEKKQVSDEFMMEFLQIHTNVLYQPSFDDKRFRGLNPYTLGYGIYKEIKRISENPTEEDKKFFPFLCGSPWLENLFFSMTSFKDESFIAQYLSPNLIRELRLFTLKDDYEKNYLEISAIHNEEDYQYIRQALASQFNLSMLEPNIQVYEVDLKGDRSLTLRHIMQRKNPLDKDYKRVLEHIHQLWGFTVKLETFDENSNYLSTEVFPEHTPQNIP